MEVDKTEDWREKSDLAMEKMADYSKLLQQLRRAEGELETAIEQAQYVQDL